MQGIVGAFGVWIACATYAPAQVQQSQVLLLDPQRLYVESAYGLSLRQALEDDRKALEAENRRLSDNLRAEELRLTELRKTMSPQDFAAAALEFDAKVEAARQAQDEKTRKADERLAQQYTVFLRQTRPIVAQMMVERGGTIILDGSTGVFMNLSAIDITDQAIERIDAALLAKQP